jgi:hypothetical protein
MNELGRCPLALGLIPTDGTRLNLVQRFVAINGCSCSISIILGLAEWLLEEHQG